ncbi:hypothetical protein CVH10_19580, partial [Halomonas sp. ND22Bw]|uniref:hypothetical protein n=1 Tax=Halomonas sp. ND22Bw TaxID=2054178 RepID=UPI000D2A4AAD
RITIGNTVDAHRLNLANLLDASLDQRQQIIGASFLSVSDAATVIRPGALLDASGTSALLDRNAGLNPSTGASPYLQASNGGAISLSSASALYLDG